MTRTIAASLLLAIVFSAAFAEDRNTAAAGNEQQKQNQQQQDRTAAEDRDPAVRDATATAGDAADAAQPAAARDEAAESPKDPTHAFVMEAYSGNLFEIQAGQLVAQKAQDDQIKQFARMLVQDHQKANQKLKEVAQSANIPIQEKLDPVHQAKIQKMQKCAAPELSRKFLFGQVAGHTMNVLEYQWQSQNAQNDQVKQYASQSLPKLQAHLRHATELATAQIGGAEARPAGERIEGDRSGTGQGAKQGQQQREGAYDRGAGTDAASPERKQSE